MYVVPRNGLSVRDPDQGDILPSIGREVAPTEFWYRRLLDGDVTLDPPDSSAAADLPDLLLLGDTTVSALHRGLNGLFVGSNAKVLTVPDIASGGFINGERFFYERAPVADPGPVRIAGLTGGRVSHPWDQTYLDVGGPICLIPRIGRTSVNGGAPYWQLVGWTRPAPVA